jgi:hypothetical protein
VADVNAVEESVQSLHKGLSALSQVLISVSLAWTSNSEITGAQNGVNSELWKCVRDGIANCTVVLEKFQRVLSKASSENGGGINILKRSVMKIKLNMSASEINGYRMELETYHRVLEIGLNAINT